MLVDMVTGCHDNDLDAIASDVPSSLFSPHHYHRQQQRRSSADTGWSINTSASNVCPELFLNTCDENMTSLSSSSSSFPAAATASAVPSHFPLTVGCASVAS